MQTIAFVAILLTEVLSSTRRNRSKAMNMN